MYCKVDMERLETLTFSKERFQTIILNPEKVRVLCKMKQKRSWTLLEANWGACASPYAMHDEDDIEYIHPSILSKMYDITNAFWIENKYITFDTDFKTNNDAIHLLSEEY